MSRAVTGFLAMLSADQVAAALAYTGDDALGDTFARRDGAERHEAARKPLARAKRTPSRGRR